MYTQDFRRLSTWLFCKPKKRSRITISFLGTVDTGLLCWWPDVVCFCSKHRWYDSWLCLVGSRSEEGVFEDHWGQIVARSQGPVVRSLVSAKRWLRGIKTYRFPWYSTLVSTNHASSNPGQNNCWLNQSAVVTIELYHDRNSSLVFCIGFQPRKKFPARLLRSPASPNKRS